MDKVCSLCRLTKFVSDAAIIYCNFCNRPICSRCGIRLTKYLHSDKFNTTSQWCCKKCRSKLKLSRRTNSLSMEGTTTSSNENNHDKDETKEKITPHNLQNCSSQILSSSIQTSELTCDNTATNKRHQWSDKTTVTTNSTEQQRKTNVTSWSLDDQCLPTQRLLPFTNHDTWLFDETGTYATCRVFFKEHNTISCQHEQITINPTGIVLLFEQLHSEDVQANVPMLSVIKGPSDDASYPANILKIGDRILEWNKHIISQLPCDLMSVFPTVFAQAPLELLVLRIQSAASMGDSSNGSIHRLNLSHSGSTRFQSMLLPRPQPKIQLGIVHDQTSLTLFVSVFQYEDAVSYDVVQSKNCYLLCRLALTPDPTGQFLRLHTKPIMCTVTSSLPFVTEIKNNEGIRHHISYSPVTWNESLSFHPLTIADLLDFSLLVSVFSYSTDVSSRYRLVGQTLLELAQCTRFTPDSQCSVDKVAEWYLLSYAPDLLSLVTSTMSSPNSIDCADNDLCDSEFGVSCEKSFGHNNQRRQLPLVPHSSTRSSTTLVKIPTPTEPMPNSITHQAESMYTCSSESQTLLHHSSNSSYGRKCAVFHEGIGKRRSRFAISHHNTVTRSFDYCKVDNEIAEGNDQEKTHCDTNDYANNANTGEQHTQLSSTMSNNHFSLPTLSTWKSESGQRNSAPLTTNSDSNIVTGGMANTSIDGQIVVTTDGKRKQSVAKALVILGLTRRTDAARRAQRRSGFLRSEEIGVHDSLKSKYSISTDQTASSSTSNVDYTQVHNNRISSLPSSFWSGALKLPHEQAFTAFVEGLGLGQLVGRQVLGSACLGEILLQLRVSEGLLQVRVERCKNLTYCSDLNLTKSTLLASCYVKLIIYKDISGLNMVSSIINHGKEQSMSRSSKSIEKTRTKLSHQSLNPIFDETLTFRDAYRNHILQILVVGERGKLDRKIFMGTAQIDLSQLKLWAGAPWITDWYKLFSSSSVLAYPCAPATDADSSQQQPRLKSNKAL